MCDVSPENENVDFIKTCHDIKSTHVDNGINRFSTNE